MLNKRSEYESKTKEIRYNIYDSIIKNYNSEGIFLAHHRGDVQENILSNIFHGRSILELPIIKEIKRINGILVFKPLINNDKNLIYKYAYNNNIPFFYDSTPKWSVRWRVRFVLLPILESIYGNVKRSLSYVGEQSDELNEIFMREIIIPYSEEIEYSSNIIKFPLREKVINRPTIFWRNIFTIAFHKNKLCAPKHKVLRDFNNNLRKGVSITFSKGVVGKKENNYFIIYIN